MHVISIDTGRPHEFPMNTHPLVLDPQRTAGEWTEPSDRDSDEAAGWIVSDTLEARFGEQLTRIFRVTDASQLPEPKLAFLFDYWQSIARRDGGKPRHRHIDVLDMVPAIRNLMLLDVRRQGFDARYRVYGTGIAEIGGRDWTGFSVSQMNEATRTSLSLMYRSCYRAVYLSQKPLYTEHTSPIWLAAKAWRRLILPLFDDDGGCAQFLVGNIPVDTAVLGTADRAMQDEILRSARGIKPAG